MPERAWNYGINTTYKFLIAHREGSLNIDAYRTEFVNQVIIDPYTDRDFIQLYNLKGESYAQSFSIAINYNLFPRLDMRLAYKLDDVHITYFETEIEKPLIGRHKGLFNLGYESINKKWRVDYTIQIDGSKKIALQSEGHHGGSTFQTSPIFTLMNGQVTKVFRKFELYAGVENATNFTQHHPIINAENPFSREFDATQIWGPIMGRRIYAGFRMKII
ncbi:MAG: TonB-dependent receptor [Bacteroidetes bacterium]|nr:TonB-dependent receptor [Bacteroidota bacterium]